MRSAIRLSCLFVLAGILTAGRSLAAPLDDLDLDQVEKPPSEAQQLNDKALKEFARRNRDEALRLLSEAIRLDSQLADAYNNRAAVYHVLGNYKQAIADYTRYIELKPNVVTAYKNRGTTYLAMGQPARALADFDRAVGLDPQDQQAHYGRGNALLSLDRAYEAVNCFNEALRIAPDFRLALRNRQVALELLKRTGAEQPTEPGDAEVARTDPQIKPDAASPPDLPAPTEDLQLLGGLVPRYSGNHGRPQAEKAAAYVAELSESIENDELNVKLWIDRGAARCEDGDYENALADLNRACTLDVQNALAYYNRGVALYECGEFEKAMSDFYEALRVAPDDVPAFFGRAMCWQRMGEKGRALVEYQEVLRRVPNHPVALINRGWILATALRARHRDGVQAVSDAEQGCQLTGWQIPGFLDTLAAAYAEAGDFQNAIRWQKKAIEQLGENGAEEMKERLALYESGKPYRESGK